MQNMNDMPDINLPEKEKKDKKKGFIPWLRSIVGMSPSGGGAFAGGGGALGSAGGMMGSGSFLGSLLAGKGMVLAVGAVVAITAGAGFILMDSGPDVTQSGAAFKSESTDASPYTPAIMRGGGSNASSLDIFKGANPGAAVNEGAGDSSSGAEGQVAEPGLEQPAGNPPQPDPNSMADQMAAQAGLGGQGGSMGGGSNFNSSGGFGGKAGQGAFGTKVGFTSGIGSMQATPAFDARRKQLIAMGKRSILPSKSSFARRGAPIRSAFAQAKAIGTVQSYIGKNSDDVNARGLQETAWTGTQVGAANTGDGGLSTGKTGITAANTPSIGGSGGGATAPVIAATGGTKEKESDILKELGLKEPELASAAAPAKTEVNELIASATKSLGWAILYAFLATAAGLAANAVGWTGVGLIAGKVLAAGFVAGALYHAANAGMAGYQLVTVHGQNMAGGAFIAGAAAVGVAAVAGAVSGFSSVGSIATTAKWMTLARKVLVGSMTLTAAALLVGNMVPGIAPEADLKVEMAAANSKEQIAKFADDKAALAANDKDKQLWTDRAETMRDAAKISDSKSDVSDDYRISVKEKSELVDGNQRIIQDLKKKINDPNISENEKKDLQKQVDTLTAKTDQQWNELNALVAKGKSDREAEFYRQKAENARWDAKHASSEKAKIEFENQANNYVSLANAAETKSRALDTGDSLGTSLGNPGVLNYNKGVSPETSAPIIALADNYKKLDELNTKIAGASGWEKSSLQAEADGIKAEIAKDKLHLSPDTGLRDKVIAARKDYNTAADTFATAVANVVKSEKAVAALKTDTDGDGIAEGDESPTAARDYNSKKEMAEKAREDLKILRKELNLDNKEKTYDYVNNLYINELNVRARIKADTEDLGVNPKNPAPAIKETKTQPEVNLNATGYKGPYTQKINTEPPTLKLTKEEKALADDKACPECHGAKVQPAKTVPADKDVLWDETLDKFMPKKEAQNTSGQEKTVIFPSVEIPRK